MMMTKKIVTYEEEKKRLMKIQEIKGARERKKNVDVVNISERI